MRRGPGKLVRWIAIGALALPPLRAHAQPLQRPPALEDPYPEEHRPWADGVPEAEQAAATALYSDGNREFAESRFAQALVKYRAALRHWDHPAIRFNIAVCLINLNQPVEARDHLTRGLAYGPAPLGPGAHAQGLTYRKLLDAQLANVRIVCREAGVEITLDGKLVFTGPGTTEQFLLPGKHQIVATRDGLPTTSNTVTLAAGELTTLVLDQVLRWDHWKPVALLGSGAVAVGLGAIGYKLASRNFEVYDAQIREHCPKGCDAATLAGLTDARRARDRGNTEQAIAFSLTALGAAAIIAGTIGLIVNQPRLQLEPLPALTVAVPAAGGTTISATWQF